MLHNFQVTYIFWQSFEEKIFFMLHSLQKYVYVIVVPETFSSKNPPPCTCFFWSAVRLDPCHRPTPHPIFQYNGIIEVLSLGIMIMFHLCHHRETACHSHPSVMMATWQISVADDSYLTAAHSARQHMCEATLYSITYHPNSYHPNSCQTSRVDVWFFFSTL